MRLNVSARTLFSLGFLVIVAVNIVVIARVSLNRTGAYETMIQLTERELVLPYRMHEENSGISLELKWRTLGKNEYDYYDSHYHCPEWLDKDKLASLGFKMSKISSNLNMYKRIVPRQAYIVLEYEGAPYQELLIRSEKKYESAQTAFQANPDNEKLRQEFKNAQSQFESDRNTASRLFAIDAGLNADTLRKKYPDRSRFIIAPGLVEMNRDYENNTTKPAGYVSRLMMESIHVPLELRRPLDDILSTNSPRKKDSPRYKVQLAYGSRYEPWIKAVDRIQ